MIALHKPRQPQNPRFRGKRRFGPEGRFAPAIECELNGEGDFGIGV
jgi:hypothetical protein